MSEIERRWQQTKLTGFPRELLSAWVAVEKSIQSAILDEEKAKFMYDDLIRRIESIHIPAAFDHELALKGFELAAKIRKIRDEEHSHRATLLNILYKVREVIKV